MSSYNEIDGPQTTSCEWTEPEQPGQGWVEKELKINLAVYVILAVMENNRAKPTAAKFMLPYRLQMEFLSQD